MADGSGLSILYHGSIVPTRLPASVLTALSLLPDRVKLRIIGYETVGHMGYTRELRQIAEKLGIAHRVEFLGTLPTRAELLQSGRCSDVGLALMPHNSVDPNERTMSQASNKPFDYLAFGMALLVTDLPDWQAMFVDTGYGLACDAGDPESIASALRWFLDHPEEMRRMGEQGRQRVASEWHYESRFRPVLELLCGERGAAPVSASTSALSTAGSTEKGRSATLGR
jgi:glycosyltransferase involved in cell wall biosynthesis